MSLTLLPVLRIAFLLLGCLVQPGYEALYLVMSCLTDIPGRPAFFLKGNGGVDLGCRSELKEGTEQKCRQYELKIKQKK